MGCTVGSNEVVGAPDIEGEADGKLLGRNEVDGESVGCEDTDGEAVGDILGNIDTEGESLG